MPGTRVGEVREMVRPEGFEPPTNGFGSHYSIRLSYERIFTSGARSNEALGGPRNAHEALRAIILSGFFR